MEVKIEVGCEAPFKVNIFTNCYYFTIKYFILL